MRARQFERQESERGAAMVELAVMMLVIVPTVLYAFFLTDAMYHKLEVQETVVASIWDFAFRDYETESIRDHVTEVQVANRAEYGDHTSAYNQPGKNRDVYNSTNRSHISPFADLFWPSCRECEYNDPKNPGKKITGESNSAEPDASGAGNADNDYWTRKGTQLTCRSVDRTAGWNVPTALGGNFSSQFSKGGLMRCWAKGVVYNYLIGGFIKSDGQSWQSSELIIGPSGNQMLKETSLAKETANAGTEDGLTSNFDDSANVIIRDQTAILVDTWGIVHSAENGNSPRSWEPAVNERFSVDPGGSSPSSPLYNRAAYLYTNLLTHTLAKAGTLAYFTKAVNQGIAVGIDVWSSTSEKSPTAFFMANRSSSGGNVNDYQYNGWFTIPMDDRDPLNQQAMFNSRGNYYLGCPQPETDPAKCF